eukprot:440447-Prorocentrum_minimum.AAC.3
MTTGEVRHRAEGRACQGRGSPEGRECQRRGFPEGRECEGGVGSRTLAVRIAARAAVVYLYQRPSCGCTLRARDAREEVMHSA